MAWGGKRPGAGRRAVLTPEERKQRDAARRAAYRAAKRASDAKVVSPAPPTFTEGQRPMFSSDVIERLLEISQERSSRARNRPRTMDWCPFQMESKTRQLFPPRALPRPKLRMAADSALTSTNEWAAQAWMAGGIFSNEVSDGLMFMGYPYLAQLAQRPEYRLFGEIRAEEMTRNWTEFRGTDDPSTHEKDKPKDRNKDDEEGERRRAQSGEKGRSDGRNKEIEAKIKELKDFEDHLQVRQWFKADAAQDSFFGIGHLYLEIKGAEVDSQNKELATDIGNGRNNASKEKLSRGCLTGMRAIEPIWAYPTTYNAQNPLRPDWYDPRVWYVMGTEIHKSRFLSFIGRPVPDILKPAYAFGGLSMTQMAQPYVDIWLRTRESVGEIIHAFSVMVLYTNLATTTTPGGAGGGSGDVIARMALANWLRDNQGTMVVDKATEDFKNVAAPVSGLDELQAQAQEHMFSVGRIPAVKFAGIQPKGLNATSEGELRAFNDTIHGNQEHLFRPNLTTIYDIMQISLWGARDPDITYDFVPLHEMTPKEKAEIRKIEAETDQIRIDSGVVSQEEVRTKVANDPESGFDSIDPEDVPDLLEEEEEGLEPVGGRPQPQAEAEAGVKPEGGAEAGDSVLPFVGDDWNEADHPRGQPGNAGQFGSGGGGGSKPTNRLTPKEKAYLSAYSGDDFLRLNTELRSGGDGGQAAQRLDSAIAKSRIPAGTKLYRGISRDALKSLVGGDEVKVGQVLSDKGFLSASTDSNIAYMNGTGGVVMEIATNENQPALDMSKISYNTDEKEVLLPRNTKLKIDGIRAPKGPGHPIRLRVSAVHETAADEWKESDHPRGQPGNAGQFGSGGGGESPSKKQAPKKAAQSPEKSNSTKSSSTEQPIFKSKKEHAAHLLEKGTTAKELMTALGWPSISVPATAKSIGMNLTKTKEGKQTVYKGTWMTPAERKAANLMPEGVRRSGGPKSRDPGTWSLNEFIVSRGGIDPKDPLIGDVRSLLGTKNKFIPGFGSLIRPGGMKLDRLREAAVEAGYIQDAGFNRSDLADTSTVQTLLDAVEQESRGDRVYRYGQNPEHVEQAEQERVAEENRRHIDDSIDQALLDSGLSTDSLTTAQRERVMQIMEKEGVADPLEAIEREAMEWVNDAAEKGKAERILDDIPGWDVPDDAKPAQRAGTTAAPF
jgi:phage-related protein (TIGR01555 family)